MMSMEDADNILYMYINYLERDMKWRNETDIIWEVKYISNCHVIYLDANTNQHKDMSKRGGENTLWRG